MEFHLPELGEGVYEVELVSWLVKPGESVKRGQNLMEVLTDKASMEVPSPFVGRVTSLKAEPGQLLKVGEAVLSYEIAGQKKDGEPEKESDLEPKEKPEQKIRKTSGPVVTRATPE